MRSTKGITMREGEPVRTRIPLLRGRLGECKSGNVAVRPSDGKWGLKGQDWRNHRNRHSLHPHRGEKVQEGDCETSAERNQIGRTSTNIANRKSKWCSAACRVKTETEKSIRRTSHLKQKNFRKEDKLSSARQQGIVDIEHLS